jgi:hypothetical protein
VIGVNSVVCAINEVRVYIVKQFDQSLLAINRNDLILGGNHN